MTPPAQTPTARAVDNHTPCRTRDDLIAHPPRLHSRVPSCRTPHVPAADESENQQQHDRPKEGDANSLHAPTSQFDWLVSGTSAAGPMAVQPLGLHPQPLTPPDHRAA